MIACNYFSGRLVPAHYSRDQLLSELNTSYFNICLMNEGFAVVMIDGERCYLGKNMILCLEPDRHIDVLAAQGVQVYSLSFSPSFINKNLTWELIRSPEYISLCKNFGIQNLCYLKIEIFYSTGCYPLMKGTQRKYSKYFYKQLNNWKTAR